MKKALVAGINAYTHPLSSLSGCVNDATKVASYLSRPEYAFDVVSLYDEAVTRAALRKAIADCLTDTNFSIIYFAGHGVRTAISTFLATYDYEEGDEGVDFNHITAAIQKLATPSQTVVVILDCCHSGDANSRAGEIGTVYARASDIPSLSGSGRIVIAACQGTETAKEKRMNGERHGVFTYYLLNALDGYAADESNAVTASLIYEYVASQLELEKIQTPVLRGDQTGRIVLGTGVKRKNSSLTAGVPPKYIESEVVLAAKKHVEDYFSSTPQFTHEEWQKRGHREACQRLEPIIEWFERRLDDNNQLKQNRDFLSQLSNISQQYQTLCNLTPGTVLDHSRMVESLLGAGTFGSVWKIESKSDVEPLCFKSYHANELRDIEKISRFSRGYKAMTQLNHPNIVKVKENTKVPLGFYMQYIDGPNLRQFNPGTSLEIEQLVALLLVIAETLQHAHGRGVLHRDVKPENILLLYTSNDGDNGGSYEPYLTDFDLSWFSTATKLTRLAEGFGSHFYAAPEQMNSPSSGVAHRPTVDSYSFGQVLFFTMCGRDPAAFDEASNLRAFSDHLGRIGINEKAAIQLHDLFEKCTFRNPDKRESDFRKICDNLSATLSHLRDSADYSSSQLLNELRFSIEGFKNKKDAGSTTEKNGKGGIISFVSPSGRTSIEVLIKLDTLEHLNLEVTCVPDEIIMGGVSSAATARATVNSRIDAALASYAKTNNCKRHASAPGSGHRYEAVVVFEHIPKSPEGVRLAREIIMRVVDCIERI